MQTRFRTLLVILICVWLVVLPLAVHAQDEGAEPTAETTAEVESEVAEVDVVEPEEPEEEESLEGIGLLMLLLGMSGVLLVGGAMINRDNPTADNEEAA